MCVCACVFVCVRVRACVRACGACMHTPPLLTHRQLDHIEEQVTEANDRQLTKWRAEQHRDDKQMEQVEQVDGRLRKHLLHPI